MAIVLKVQWIDLSADAELHRRIRHIGGASGDMQWKHSHDFAIASIERGSFDYYLEGGAKASRVGIGRTPDGKKFLTVMDKTDQSLLELPQFPDPASPQPARPKSSARL